MTTTVDDPIFVDANVLVYAASQSAPLHELAVRAVSDHQQAGQSLAVSRQILREYLAVMSRPQFFQKPPPVADLVADIQDFAQRFLIIEDGPKVTAHLLDLLTTIPVGGKQIHDANIVATMLAHGIPRLLTHNVGDFKRFSTLIEILPLVEAKKNGK
jgi:predicted nucleic acid-binding protein